MNTRTETDSLGIKNIPIDALYGIQTLRAVENFPISGISLLPEMVKAYAYLKRSCAITNSKLGLLDKNKSELIVTVCDEIIEGKYKDQFVVDIFQAGAGTSTNMNLNEVISNRAIEILGKEKGNYDVISPNDDVNMSQSTNDTFPTAIRIAITLQSKSLLQSLKNLQKSFNKKGEEFISVIKSARTHLQDAVPITLGQEFSGWALTIEELIEELEISLIKTQKLGIGGSAAGTGMNTHKDYAKNVVSELSKATEYKFTGAKNLIENMQSQKELLDFAGKLKNIAIQISRISKDLRLLSSGPNTGLGEITLPPVQPGSSIMPGKINPSILECMDMICYRIIGSETTISYATQNGQIDLNPNMPLMAIEILTSIKILTNGCNMTAKKCIDGITANKEVCENYAYKSASLATVLNPIFGYMKTGEIVKESLKTKKSIPEIILEQKLMDKKELDEILDPKKMTKPM